MGSKLSKTRTIRIPNEDYDRMVLFAAKKQMKVSEWLRPIIHRAVNPGKATERHE